MKGTLGLLAVGLLMLAGCSTPPAEPTAFDPMWSVRALNSDEGHDHADPLQHLNLSTPNFHVLAHDALDSAFYGGPPGSTLCGDAAEVEGGRRIAAIESRSKVGFLLADVTDPADPEWLGELVMENTRVYDVAVVPGGRHVVLATSQLENLPADLPLLPAAGVADAASGATWTTPCNGTRPVLDASASTLSATDPLPAPGQVILVDIADPTAPVIVDRQPLTSFGHSAFSTVIDDRAWVLISTVHGPYPPGFPEEVTSGWEFFDIRETPAGARLNLLSTYFARGDLVTTFGERAHDGWIAKHPITGQTLAYLVGGKLLTVLDLADPASPKPIATWTDATPGREGYSASLHSALPLDRLWDARHYTIIGPEFGGHPVDVPSGIIWVLDTTDPTAPKEVAGWTLPHEVEWTGEYMFSNHYYSVHNTTLFVSMYHGGVWAVDLAPVLTGGHTAGGFLSLPSIGVFLPVDPTAEVAVKVRWAPTVEEAIAFPDGTILTFDSFTGIWSFRFDATMPAPSPEPWPIVPPHLP